MGGPVGGVIGGAIAGSLGAFLFARAMRNAHVTFSQYQNILLIFLMGVVVAFDWSRGFVVSPSAGREINYKSVGPLTGSASKRVDIQIDGHMHFVHIV
jgi:hypothetical protein